MGPTGPATFFSKRVAKIEYDGQGRVIKITTTQVAPTMGSPIVEEFSYNAMGNKVYPPAWGVVYDNKQNLNRTNDIWQFLNRDYSMNNPFQTADTYNATGFPTKIKNGPRPYSFSEQNIQLQNSQISYACRPALLLTNFF